MKKISALFVVIIATSFAIRAQGNLQFNQVLHEKFSATGSGTNTLIGTITVPASKVWKIESGSLVNSTYFTPLEYIWCMTVDAQIITGGTTNGSAGGYTGYYPMTTLSPVWLPAGTYNVNVSSQAISGNPYTATLSVIEYNIIP